jgi:hypothetical protein
MDDYAQATREAKAAEQQLGNPPSSPGGPTSNNNGNGDDKDKTKNGEVRKNWKIQDRMTGTIYETKTNATEEEANDWFRERSKNRGDGK